MFCAEDRQWDGETQVAQGHDFIQATSASDIGLRGPQRNQEKYDAGAAHPNRLSRDLLKCGEQGCVHVDAKHNLTLFYLRAFPRRTSPGDFMPGLLSDGRDSTNKVSRSHFASRPSPLLDITPPGKETYCTKRLTKECIWGPCASLAHPEKTTAWNFEKTLLRKAGWFWASANHLAR